MALLPSLENTPVEVAGFCLRYVVMKNIFERRITLKSNEVVTLKGMWEQKLTEGTIDSYLISCAQY